MSHLEKIGLPVVGCAMLVFGGLWIVEQRSSVELTRELGATRDLLTETEGKVEGLEQANRRLQLRLQEVPILALTGEREGTGREELTLPSTVWEDFQNEENPDVVEGTETSRPSGNDRASRADRERTPEEEAERAARRAEREQRRLEARQRMNDELQARREFFSMINTEGLAPEYVQANARLVEAMGEMQILMAQMSVEDVDRDTRRELMGKIRETSREARGLMETQKDILLYDYAELELGLDDAKKQEFIEYMKTVNDFTTMPSYYRGGRR